MEQEITNNYIDQNEQKVVLTIKYKIYTVIFIIAMAIGWWYVKDTAAQYDATRQAIDHLQLQKIEKDAEYQKVVNDLTVVKDITDHKADLVSCLSRKWCASLPGSLSGVLPQVKAFLQLQKNDGTKMEFDQKKILANINEYLVKSVDTNQPNGSITSVTFGNTSAVADFDEVIQIPITLTIDFADKNGLLSFIYNIENTISSQFPMFYEVSSVNYDIVKYQQNQTVTIELIGYMLK